MVKSQIPVITMSTYNKVSERRRFPRYEINIGAILSFEGSNPFAMEEQITLKCSILDFCTHGLFLEIKKSLTDLSQLLHKKGKVFFPMITEQGRKYAEVEAQVVRVSPKGVGVSFENISESIFKALLRKAQKKTKSEPSDSRIRFDSSLNKEQFKMSLKELLGDNLPVIMEAFFKRVRIDLEEAAKLTTHFREEAVYLDAISDLRFFQSAIVKDFCWSLCEEMEFIRKISPEDLANNTDENMLSLVAKDDFEEWLTLSSCTKKIASAFSEQISQLELKLSYVTGIPRNDLYNPVHPGNLYNSFKESISKIEGIGSIKPTLYKAFDAALIHCLPHLYHSFDRLLGDCGAPNRIGEGIVRPHNTTSKPDPDATVMRNPPQEVQQSVQPLTEQDQADNQLNHQMHRGRQGQPVAQTVSRLLDIIHQRDAVVGPASHAHGRDVLNYAVYSSDEIVAAIAQLHAKTVANNAIQHDSAKLQKHLTDILAASTSVAKQFSVADKNRLVLYRQLFDTLMNDLAITPHVRPYLELIQLPLLAQALMSSDFLDSERHPARSVVNQLFSLESAVKGNRIVRNIQIRQTLDKLFNRIVQEAMNHPEIFALVNEELKEITQTIAKSKELNIRRVVEAYEGKQKLETARNIIQNEIDHRIAGKWIPSIIPTLLDSGWQHLLVITELNGENKANSRQKFLKTLDRLLDWLNQREPFGEEETDRIQQELALIDNQLGSVCTNAFLHGKVMDELKAVLLEAGNPLVRKSVEKIFIEPRKQEKVTSTEIIENNWTCQVNRMKPGDWVTLSLETEGFEPLKLVWSGGNDPKIYVFVNREGQKKLELNQYELASLMRAGSANKIENLDEPLMDRAANRVLQEVYEKLAYNASHDQVTHLINRREFLKLLKQELLSMDESSHMLCYMEILDFRLITNTCGLIAGDKLLRNITQKVKNQLNQNVLFARLGDKIFGILIKHCSDHEGYEIAQKLREIINKSHFAWGDKSYSIGVSIGLVPFYDHGYNAEELLQHADSASITAKRSGNNRIRVYKHDDASIKAQTDIHDWAGRIDQIFYENRLFVRCQKISPIEPEKNRHSHYEILLGLNDRAGNIISPGDFLPAVEHCRRMPEIDRWVTDTVFCWIEQNRSFFDSIGGFAINLSGQSLNSEEFLNHLVRRLSACTVPLEKITFEVTETVASDNLIFTETFISQIKQFGCKFSLDDFGTGYSSYSYLKSLDVDFLKIDGSFVKEMAANPTDVAMVKSMNEIAHSLGLETIAEYVENEEIYTILKEIGVDYGQGWVIHKPVRLADLTN